MFTYTIVHYASHPDVADCLPYLVVLVELPEMPGVRLISNLTGVPPEEINIGMEVEMYWEKGTEDLWLPRFRIP